MTWLVPMMMRSWRMFWRMCISWRDELCESGGNLKACLRLFAETINEYSHYKLLFCIVDFANKLVVSAGGSQ
jgi:hypothetical protein